MPELPEVETIKRGLEKLLASNPKVKGLRLRRGDLREAVTAKELGRLNGESWQGARRRAKYLLFDFDRHTLVSHLGMSGSWRIEPADSDSKKHDHFEIEFIDGKKLIFHDPRRFGLLRVIARGAENSLSQFRNLGPEPLDNRAFTLEKFIQNAKNKKVAVKIWMMNPKVVVGVGNIYASESLYLAKIDPRKQAGRLSREELSALQAAIRRVLKSAIKNGGTTLRDYRNAEGGSGEFRRQLMVYERENESCRLCGTAIRRATMGGRSTYWCPKCQVR